MYSEKTHRVSKCSRERISNTEINEKKRMGQSTCVIKIM